MTVACLYDLVSLCLSIVYDCSGLFVCVSHFLAACMLSVCLCLCSDCCWLSASRLSCVHCLGQLPLVV